MDEVKEPHKQPPLEKLRHAALLLVACADDLADDAIDCVEIVLPQKAFDAFYAGERGRLPAYERGVSVDCIDLGGCVVSGRVDAGGRTAP